MWYSLITEEGVERSEQKGLDMWKELERREYTGNRIKIGKELGRRIVLKVYYSFKRIYIYDIKNILVELYCKAIMIILLLFLLLN